MQDPDGPKLFDASTGESFSLPTGAVSPAAQAAAQNAIKLGELLIQQGELTPMQVRHILDVQAVTRRPFGDLAERLFDVSPGTVADAWVEQYVQRHGLHDVSDQPADHKCIALIQTRQAWQFRFVPLRREQIGSEESLLIAADRRGLVRAMNFAGRSLPMTPSFIVAEPDSLKTLLQRHYPVAQQWATFAFGKSADAPQR